MFPLFTYRMYAKFGIQGAGSLAAGVGTLLAVTPFVLFKYGDRLRARSKFATELAKRNERHDSK